NGQERESDGGGGDEGFHVLSPLRCVAPICRGWVGWQGGCSPADEGKMAMVVFCLNPQRSEIRGVKVR
ncbi:MAG: hypothetical protein AAF390_19820, partial [Pseudomonadota bacterium]